MRSPPYPSLQLLDHRIIVTIDAMGCQKEIAREIIEAQADYLLAVKENDSDWAEEFDFEGVPYVCAR